MGVGAGVGAGVGSGVGCGVGCGGGATPVRLTAPQPSLRTQVWIDTTWLGKRRFEQPALLSLAS